MSKPCDSHRAYFFNSRRILRKCGDAQDVQISFVHRNGLWSSFSCTNQEETGEIRPFTGDLNKETFFYDHFIVQTRFVQVTWFRSVFQALDKADVKQEAPAVAFTCGPGLPGSLLVGPPPRRIPGSPPLALSSGVYKYPLSRSISASVLSSEASARGPISPKSLSKGPNSCAQASNPRLPGRPAYTCGDGKRYGAGQDG